MNATLLSDRWVTEEKIVRMFKKLPNSSEDETTTYQTLLNRRNPIVRGNFMVMPAYI